MKTKQTKKALVSPGFLPAAKWALPRLPGLWFWRNPHPAQGVHNTMLGLCPVSRLPCPRPWSRQGWPGKVPQLCRDFPVGGGLSGASQAARFPDTRWAPCCTGQKALPPPGGAGGDTPGKQGPWRDQHPPGQCQCRPAPLGRSDSLPGTQTTGGPERTGLRVWRANRDRGVSEFAACEALSTHLISCPHAQGLPAGSRAPSRSRAAGCRDPISL